MSNKPVVLVTRKLPAAVEQKLAQNFATILNPDDKLYSTDELLALAAGADAILPCHTEKFPAATIAQLPARVKAIANFSVGVDHVDLAAGRRRGKFAGWSNASCWWRDRTAPPAPAPSPPRLRFPR